MYSKKIKFKGNIANAAEQKRTDSRKAMSRKDSTCELGMQEVPNLGEGDEIMDRIQKVGGPKTQKFNANKKNKGDLSMESKHGFGEEDSQDLVKDHKYYEAENIAALKQKLVGLELAYETDDNIIPIKPVNVNDLIGVTLRPWDSFWEHQKIDLRVPVILGRQKNVIAGPYQFFEAVENGMQEIDAVYIDSLKEKVVSASNLRKQFKEKSIYIGFAYSLYALTHDSVTDIIEYSEFYKNFNKIFDQIDIFWGIYDYIRALDEEFGG